MNSRQHSKDKLGVNTAFLDMLFNMTLAFAFLFLIALMLVRPSETQKKAVELKAEFLLTMTWPGEAFDDIDMWILLPDGKKVWFRQQDVDHVTLDRDDMGALGDLVYPKNEGPKLTKVNKEMITIRAIVPGRYVVAAHAYRVYNKIDHLVATVNLPYDVSLEVLKINPSVSTVGKSSVTLDSPAQQATFLAFTVDDNGTVSRVEMHPDDAIVDLTSTGN